MRQLAQSNLAEIATSQLALEKSTNDDVKKFAQQMVDDHTKALGQLQQIAQQKGVELPTQPDAKHRAMGKKLGALSGDAFDRQYLASSGMADHRQAHQLVTRVSKQAKDPDLKALAEQMEPTIEQHLQMARDVRREQSGATSSGASGSSSGGTSDSSSGSTSGPSGASDTTSGSGSSGASDTPPSGTSGSTSGGAMDSTSGSTPSSTTSGTSGTGSSSTSDTTGGSTSGTSQ